MAPGLLIVKASKSHRKSLNRRRTENSCFRYKVDVVCEECS
jgi:hypothetical protein